MVLVDLGDLVLFELLLESLLDLEVEAQEYKILIFVVH